MADLTRRSLVGGALALPAVALPLTLPAPVAARTAWEAAQAELAASGPPLCRASDAADEADAAFRVAMRGLPRRPDGVRFGPRLPGETDQQCMDRCFRETHAAADRWDRRAADVRRKHRVDELRGEAARYAEARTDALWRVYETPAPDLDALTAKVELMHQEGDLEWDSTIEAILADLRRLARIGRA